MASLPNKVFDAERTIGSASQKLRRGQARVAVRLPVVVEHAMGHAEGTATDLGLGGMFIETCLVLSYGERAHVLFEMPGEPRPLRLPAVVRWSNQSGFGVQFLELGARDTYAISALVADLRQQDGMP